MLTGKSKPDFAFLPFFSQKLISLWDMKDYPTGLLVHVMARFDHVKTKAHVVAQKIRMDNQKELQEALPWLGELGLATTRVTCEQLVRDIQTVSGDVLVGKLDALIATLNNELKTHQFFVLDLGNAYHFNNPHPVSDQFSQNWPKANKELLEAQKCFALDRHKSCVFHCCLAYESGLIALGKRLKLKKKNDWGGWINAIRLELSKRAVSRRSRKRDFYARCVERFDLLRVGTRNPVSHIEIGVSYTERDAEDILLASIAFLKEVSTAIPE